MAVTQGEGLKRVQVPLSLEDMARINRVADAIDRASEGPVSVRRDKLYRDVFLRGLADVEAETGVAA